MHEARISPRARPVEKFALATCRSRFLSLCAVAIAVAFSPQPAEAQDCGSWYRPVLCQVELVAVDSNYQRVALGERSRIELAPREQISLELDARDQGGRRFPRERLAIGYDDGDCRRMLNVEDRGEGEFRVSAASAQGRCTLEIWVPNNLNFFWEIDVEIRAAARTIYSRPEAEVVVNAVYAALLTRAPDAASFSSAVAEIRSGNLETLLNAMLRSQEFREVTSRMTAAQILEQFYLGILDREGDSAGVRLYLGEMQRRQYVSVLLKLIRSPEFERRLG